MFHFRFDLEDGVDEPTFAQDVPLSSTPQKTGEPFSEIEIDSLVCIVYPIHPHAPSLSSIKSSWKHYRPKYLTPSYLLRRQTIRVLA